MLLGVVDLRTTGIDADGPRSLGCFYGGTIDKEHYTTVTGEEVLETAALARSDMCRCYLPYTYIYF